MGERSQETVEEIERTREALGQKVDALAAQMRKGIDTARSTGLKIGGITLAAVAGWITWRKIRRR